MSITVPITLQNAHLQLNLHPDFACWDLSGRENGTLSLLGVRMGVVYRTGSTHFTALERWDRCEVSAPERVESPHGSQQQVHLKTGPDSNGLQIGMTFALPDEHPILLWKLTIKNHSAQPVYPEQLELLKAGYSPGNGPNTNHRPSSITNLKSSAFFSNGWGSWDYCGVYGSHDRFIRTRLGPFLAPMRVNPGTPHPKDRGHFSSDMFGVLGDRKTRQALLAGFLSQQEHFGSLETWLRGSHPTLHMWANADSVRLDPGNSMTTDWACLHFLDIDSREPLAPYLDTVAREHNLPEVRNLHLQSPPTGWCSWYQFYLDVSEKDIRRNLDEIDRLRAELPLELVQIDDGFEPRVGDWFEFRASFPDGVAPLASEIQGAGFTPGLWLAPYIVHPRSQLASEHPDWLIGGRFKRPANAGFSGWGSFTRGLDLTHPDALAYTQEVVHTAVSEWGFPYLKLDFLYAGAIRGKRRDPTKTRAQVLRTGLEALREAAGDQTVLLGCGCPLGPAIGVVDAMRIGPDVDGHWYPNMFALGAIIKNEPGLPSTRNAIHNTLTRAFTHQRWWINDPDCLLLRPDTKLTFPETQSLAATIALSGGSVLLSDDLPGLPSDRMRLAQVLLPPIGLRARVMDWFDSSTPTKVHLDLYNASGSWHLLAAFNWDENPQDTTLQLVDYSLDPAKAYIAHQFWNGEIYRINGGKLKLHHIPAHGVNLLAVREHTRERPIYVGSDLHISQGLEVVEWQVSPSSLSMSLRRPGLASGEIILYLPGAPHQATLDGEALLWHASDVEGCYRYKVKFNQTCNLVIDY